MYVFAGYLYLLLMRLVPQTSAASRRGLGGVDRDLDFPSAANICDWDLASVVSRGLPWSHTISLKDQKEIIFV